MRFAPAAVLSLWLAALLAACTDAPKATGVEIEFITPGTWTLAGSPDRILIWARNRGPGTLDLLWNASSPNGTALPDGWNVTFSPPSTPVKAAGTKATQRGRTTYPDWTWTLATITGPPEAFAAGSNRTPAALPLRITAGPGEWNGSVPVAPGGGRLSGPGDSVAVEYTGRFQHNGEEFDSGGFTTQLGSGQTVPGFDYGLMGLAPGERVTIVVPPALAYGFDNPPGPYEKFNGRTLLFEVEITAFKDAS